MRALDTRSVYAALQLALLAAAAVAVRAANLDRPPSFDELYHVLAARSWVLEGTLRIADGEYTRTALYTIGIGRLFQWFGESLFIARLPSLIAGALSVLALYLWTRRVAGNLAAWIAALLLCFAPIAIDVSQFARFYAAHSLLFWLGGWGVYAMLCEDIAKSRLPGIIFGSVLAFVAAFYLHSSTLVGLFGIALWMAFQIGPTWWRAWSKPQLRLPLALLHILILVLLSVALWKLATAGYYEYYRATLPWSVDPDLRYYVWILADQYPLLWTLLPLIALIALAHRNKPALFCLCVFGVTLVVLSFAGTQAERYICFVLPHLFSLAGMAVALLAPLVRDTASAAIQKTLGLRQGTLAFFASLVTCLAVVGVFLVVFSPALTRAAGTLTAPNVTQAPDWKRAAEMLETWPLRESAVIITTSSLPALYYLGHYDVEFNRAHVGESDTGQDFGIDGRTGRPTIGSVTALKRVLACHRTGIFIDSFPFARDGSVYSIGSDVEALLVSAAKQLTQPDNSRLRIYVWDQATKSLGADCGDLPRLGSAPNTR